MKKTFFYPFLLICFLNVGSVSSQVNNIILDTQPENLWSGPKIAINAKNKENIVVFADADNLHVTKDGGLTWTKSKISGRHELFGSPVIISDRKGDFYVLRPSATAAKSKTLRSEVICYKSTDGGLTWSDESSGEVASSKQKVFGSAVADPNSSRLYTVWKHSEHDQSNDTCTKSILLSENNGGKKWSDPAVIDKTTSEACTDSSLTGAVAAVGPDEQLYVAWSHENKIYLDRSLNKGKNWLRNNILVTELYNNTSTATPNPEQTTRPILIADNSKSQYGGMLYLSWSGQRNGTNSDIWFMRSANSGDTWTTPAKVNSGGPSKQQFFSRMAIDNSTGIIYIVYYEAEIDSLETDVYLAYSKDGGNSFVNKKISEKSFTADEHHTYHISVGADKGQVAPVWRRIDDGKKFIVTTVIPEQELTGLKTKADKKRARKN